MAAGRRRPTRAVTREVAWCFLEPPYHCCPAVLEKKYINFSIPAPHVSDDVGRPVAGIIHLIVVGKNEGVGRQGDRIT